MMSCDPWHSGNFAMTSRADYARVVRMMSSRAINDDRISVRKCHLIASMFDTNNLPSV